MQLVFIPPFCLHPKLMNDYIHKQPVHFYNHVRYLTKNLETKSLIYRKSTCSKSPIGSTNNQWGMKEKTTTE
ncbi:hypothetical protein CWS20_04235 [Cytobacillus horneckiae]|uniref:Uncharacterized protein n=2 Tax=Cytobacillus horneckiae TaxID=549687 RepID=A0A2N0ZL23_9BACI|nr:hypothetical protein CWS20_04235 [Cytobacillus horneckiae]